LHHQFHVMPNFEQLRIICRKNSEISANVVDDFLIEYTALRNRVGGDFDKGIKTFNRLLKKFPPGTKGYFKSQYIAHKIFRKNGLIHSLLLNSRIKDLIREEKEFLLNQSEVPWRFSFSTIKKSPSKDFYEMEDEFRGETFLLYSPGVATILKTNAVGLWLNLIGFNGQCWQSYGPIGHYQSFGFDDIFFFGSELNPDIESDEDLVEDVERNPISYLMLMSGATLPVIENGGQRIIFLKSHIHLPSLDTDKLTPHFSLLKEGSIRKLEVKELDGFPHFARAYYNIETKELELNAMTERGYNLLVDRLKKRSIPVPDHFDMRVNPTMFTTAGDILNKNLVFDEHEHLFARETSPDDQKRVDKMNNLLELMTPSINANMKPDYTMLSKKTGLMWKLLNYWKGR